MLKNFVHSKPYPQFHNIEMDLFSYKVSCECFNIVRLTHHWYETQETVNLLRPEILQIFLLQSKRWPIIIYQSIMTPDGESIQDNPKILHLYSTNNEKIDPMNSWKMTSYNILVKRLLLKKKTARVYYFEI